MLISAFFVSLILSKQLFAQQEFLEKNSFNLILNNLDSLNIRCVKHFKNSPGSAIYYRYSLEVDSAKLRDYIYNSYQWKDKYRIFDTSAPFVKGVNFINDTLNHNIYKQNEISSYDDFKAKSINGDLYFLILKNWEFNGKKYVLMVVNANGSIVEGRILVVYKSNGETERILLAQSEI